MPDISTNRAQDNTKKQAGLRDTFVALCQSRALRFSLGELTGIEAVDWLQDWAFTRGLIDAIGQDEVQAIMSNAFRPYRED